MSNESLEDQINAFLPKGLDVVIRKNRDKLILLLHIGYVAHLWGWGKYFDVSYIEC